MYLHVIYHGNLFISVLKLKLKFHEAKFMTQTLKLFKTAQYKTVIQCSKGYEPCII